VCNNSLEFVLREWNEMQFYHFDALGNTVLLTRPDGDYGFGRLHQTYYYGAWGETYFYGSPDDNPYQYVGQLGYYTHYQDATLGMLQLGVRFYEPGTGRFGQRDAWTWLPGDIRSFGNPIAAEAIAAAGTKRPVLFCNRYVGLHNSPTVFVDPSGKGSFKCKNPKPPKVCRNGITNFHWCRGCEACCVRYCNEHYIEEPGDEWDKCLNACRKETPRCQGIHKWKYEARW
jgi:RHS repeat-associated protein